MSPIEKPPELTVEHILSKANRRLSYELQVRPDDPICDSVPLPVPSKS